MDLKTEFEFVEALWLWLVPALVFVLLLLPKPTQFQQRCWLAIGAGWLFTIVFTLLVYIPAAVELSNTGAQQFSEFYDDNTASFALFFGWVCPTVIVALFAGVRYVWLRRRQHAS